jgi:hypothetical protein
MGRAHTLAEAQPQRSCAVRFAAHSRKMSGILGQGKTGLTTEITESTEKIAFQLLKKIG